VEDFVAPIRSRTLDLLDDPVELYAILAEGASRAKEVASATLAEVYARVGFVHTP
jgi:tryptophanyl-tRNA synthetase